MSEFKKETRYLVLKLSKLTDHQKTAIGAVLSEINLDDSTMPECVVVEHDWPNYQETWGSIQAIVEGRYVSRDVLVAQVEAIKSAYQNLCGAISDMDDCESGTDEMETAIGAVFHAMRNGYSSVHATPTQHLRDRDAEKGRAGFIAGYESAWAECFGIEKPQFLSAHKSDQYAEKVRSGEV